MKEVNFGNGRVYDIPTDWDEAEEMITKELRNGVGRGANNRINSVCARIAWGLTCDQSMTPDPMTALAYLIQRICIRKGAGLDARQARQDPSARK